MDCIYTYKGQTYSYADLIKKLSEKDLASLKERGLISVDSKTFEGSLSSPTIFKDIDNAIAGENYGVVTTDKDGNVVTTESIKGSKGSFDETGVKKFANDVNDIYRENNKTAPGVKVVVADAKTFNEVHKEYYDGVEASEYDEAFYDPNTKTMYINASQASLDAPLHESTHIWFKFIEKRSPRIFQAGINIAKASSQYNKYIKYKQAYDMLRAKYQFEKKSDAEAKTLAMEQAKNQVVLSKADNYLYEYFDITLGSGIEGENNLASEILSRETEKAFKTKSNNEFSKWYTTMIESFVDKKGFKGLTYNQVSNLSLKDFTSKLADEVSGGIRTKSGKARMATTKLIEDKTPAQIAAEQQRNQNKSPQQGRGAAKKETKPEPIYSTDVIDILNQSNKGKAILKKAEDLFEQSGLLQEYAENEGLSMNNLTPQDVSSLTEQILGDIMVGNLRVPAEFAGSNSIGTLSTRRGSMPSGLVGDAFKELGDGLSKSSGKDVSGKQIKSRLTNEVKPTTAEKIPFAKAKAAYETENIDSGIKSEEEQIIDKIVELQDLLNVEDLSPENKKAIRNEINELVKKQQAISENQGKVYKGSGDIEALPSSEKPLKKISDREEDVVGDVVNIRTDEKKLAKRQINLKNWLLPADRKLPMSALSELEKAQGMKAYYERTDIELLNTLKNEMSEYIGELNQGKTEPDPMGTAEGLSKVIDNALKGDRAAFDLLSPKLKTTVDLMRSNIDNASEFIMGTGWLSAAELSEYQKNLGTYVARLYDKYTTPNVPVSKKVKDRIISKIPGLRVLVKEDKPIANAQWVKDLSPEQIKNAIDGFQTWVKNGYSDTAADINAGTGFRQRAIDLQGLKDKLTAETQKKIDAETAMNSGEVKNKNKWQTEYNEIINNIDKLTKEYEAEENQYNKDVIDEAKRLYEDAIQHVEKGQYMESANGSINTKQFMKRKDLPQWYREVIGESNNVFKNYFYTIGRLQNLGNKLQLHNNILEMGLEAGYIVKGNVRDNKYKNYVLVGGESAYPGATKKMQGPLYGYKMDPLLYKAMFEMPSFTIGDETLQSTLAQKIGNVYMGQVDLVNMMKVSLNLSSIIRNFESYFKGAFMLSGTYPDLIRMTTSMAKKGSNFLVDGTLYYENRSAEQKGKTEGYIKGLAQDALQDGAITSISEDAINQWVKVLNSDNKFDDALKIGNTDALYKQFYNSMGYMAKAAVKGMQKLFILGDVAPKMVQYEIRRNTISLDIYGKNFYELNEKQMKAVREAASLDVKEDFATPSRAAEFGKFRGVGTFARYRYEMYRTMYNTARQVAGYDLDKSYKHIKFSDDKLENQDMINKLARNKRRTKMIGAATFSGALQGTYALMSGIFNSSKEEDQMKQNGVITNSGLGETNLMYEMYANAKAVLNGDASMRQTVQLVLPDYLYDKSIEYTYDPKTKKMTVLNLSQNDQFAVVTDWLRGLMYDKSPSDRPYADYKGVGNRSIDVVSDQLLTFGGAPVLLLTAFKAANDKKTANESQSEGLINKTYVNGKNFVQGVLPGDMSTYTKNAEMAKYANEEWVDAAGNTINDMIVSGFRGKKMEINVYGSLSGRIRKEHKRASDAIIMANEEVDKILNLAATRYKKEDGSRVNSFYEIPSFDQKQAILEDKDIKEQLDKQKEILNKLLRATVKANKMYYNAAKKFSFSKEELDTLFKDANSNRVDVGKIKGDILFDEDYMNILQRSEKEIDTLDFGSMLYSLD
jgi:hypothetical protein